jgi:hypothetical protein
MINCDQYPRLQIVINILVYKLWSISSFTNCDQYPRLQIVINILVYKMFAFIIASTFI